MAKHGMVDIRKLVASDFFGVTFDTVYLLSTTGAVG
jgi:hypothetical protein